MRLGRQSPTAKGASGLAAPARKAARIGAIILTAGILAACQGDDFASGSNKHNAPISAPIKRKMAALDMTSAAPIMIRIFKEESSLEVWKQNRSGRYELLEEFEICEWSGELGPKFKEGDRQAPEGFYEITPALMNPYSSYHLAFNLGFPNQYDQAHERTGSHLMVHGACSSRGCYAMTDEHVQEIYALARDSFKGGQRTFQVQAFPFRMTAENMARHRDSEHFEFWTMLKTGYDHFEVTKTPPQISVCEKKYVFDATPLVEGVPFTATAKCPDYEVAPEIAVAVADKQARDGAEFTQIVARYEARQDREQRWDERQRQIAEILSFGSDANTGSDEVVTGSTPTGSNASAPALAATATGDAPAVPRANPAAVKTSFSSTDKGAGGAGAFFKRLVPFGARAHETGPTPEVGLTDTVVVPSAKP